MNIKFKQILTGPVLVISVGTVVCGFSGVVVIGSGSEALEGSHVGRPTSPISKPKFLI